MKPFPKPIIIPIFIPHWGCSHRCVFCNQTTITGTRSLPSPQSIVSFIDRNFPRHPGNRPVQVAFFGGNFLGLEPETITGFLEAVTVFVKKGAVEGIRFSTRPDSIHSTTLDLIDGFAVSTVEIGAQSMNDRVLRKSCREHNAQHSIDAVAKLKEKGYQVGIQMMVGLPGDNHESCIESGEKIASLMPDFVRIYPTVVVQNSALARWTSKGIYRPLETVEAVQLVKSLYRIFSAHGIGVIRMGLQASKDLDTGADVVAGPYHPAFGHMVFSSIFLDCMEKQIIADGLLSQSVDIHVNPKTISRVQGLKKENLIYLKQHFNLPAITITPDKELAADQISINGTTVAVG